MRVVNPKPIDDYLAKKRIEELALRSNCSIQYLNMLRRGGYDRKMRETTKSCLLRALNAREEDLFIEIPDNSEATPN